MAFIRPRSGGAWERWALRPGSWRVLVAGLAAVFCVAGLFDDPAVARSVPGVTIGSWELQSVATRPRGSADQGVATIVRPGGGTVVLTRGHSSVPRRVRTAGWIHIGDPDSRAGWVIDAYQGGASARAKAFGLTTPTGHRTVYRHALLAGESYHNSFAAFTPDRRWFVAGEWHTMHRLLVFATPGSSRSTADLRLASTIRLDRPVRDVQGCVFVSAMSLLCSTNDPGTDLFPAAGQLLAVHLTAPVGRGSVTGDVDYVGAVPQDPACAAPGETEGIDVHGSTLIVSVNSSCRGVTLLNTFRPDSMPDSRY